MTDRETVRLVALLREAASAMRLAATYDATLPARLRLTADELIRGVYRNPPETPDCSETPKGSGNPELLESYQNAIESPRNDQCDVGSAREDRRDHDRFPALSL